MWCEWDRFVKDSEERRATQNWIEVRQTAYRAQHSSQQTMWGDVKDTEPDIKISLEGKSTAPTMSQTRVLLQFSTLADYIKSV